MNTTKTLIAAALAIAAVGTASAQQATYERPQPVTSSVSRAAVQAEAALARSQGTLATNEYQRQQREPFVASRSRAEVLAETRAAAARGELQAQNRELSGPTAGVYGGDRGTSPRALRSASL